ncbi:MAG TPA: NUDIX-like domain-containing protein, partial [Candidatus Acidoferrales bacterium]|nr:NUDIX-like domain-containing protein [Candidatus Acidoferrales bacterium]
MKFVFRIVPPKEGLTELSWWFVIQEEKLLIQQKSNSTTIPLLRTISELGLSILRQHYLGRLEECDCFTVEVPQGCDPPHGMRFEGLREV